MWLPIGFDSVKFEFISLNSTFLFSNFYIFFVQALKLRIVGLNKFWQILNLRLKSFSFVKFHHAIWTFYNSPITWLGPQCTPPPQFFRIFENVMEKPRKQKNTLSIKLVLLEYDVRNPKFCCCYFTVQQFTVLIFKTNDHRCCCLSFLVDFIVLLFIVLGGGVM